MPRAKLERVMWRIRTNKPTDSNRVSIKILRQAIIHEIGYNKRTYTSIKKALVTIGWIKPDHKHWILLTNKDITEA